MLIDFFGRSLDLLWSLTFFMRAACTILAVGTVGLMADGIRLNDVAVNNDGHLVVVGGFMEESGVILDSRDDDDWYQQSAPSQNGVWAVCHGEGQWVAVGHAGTVAYSSDGVSWMATAQIPGESWLFDVIYADGQYLAGGINGIYISEDGKAWRRVDKDSNIYGLTYGNGLYVAVGYGGRVMTSKDGISWEYRETNTSFMLRSVAYGAGVYIAVGGEGRHGMVMSYDGLEWFEASSGSNAQLMEIVWTGEMFVLVGGVWEREPRQWSAGSIEYSSDGRNWVTHFSPTQSLLNAVAIRGDDWIVIGRNGYVGQVGKLSVGLEIVDLVAGDRLLIDFDMVEAPLSLPRLGIVIQNQTAVLSWQSQAGRTYRVRYSTDLKGWNYTGESYDGTGDVLVHRELLQKKVSTMFFRLEIF